MIEKVILEYLNSALTVPCYMEFPEIAPDEIAPDEFIVITKIGASRTNWIYSSTFEFQCVSTSLEKAATLCETLKAAMDDAVTLTEVSRARYAGDYNATFTASKSYRYKAVYEVTHY